MYTWFPVAKRYGGASRSPETARRASRAAGRRRAFAPSRNERLRCEERLFRPCFGGFGMEGGVRGRSSRPYRGLCFLFDRPHFLAILARSISRPPGARAGLDPGWGGPGGLGE